MGGKWGDFLGVDVLKKIIKIGLSTQEKIHLFIFITMAMSEILCDQR